MPFCIANDSVKVFVSNRDLHITKCIFLLSEEEVVAVCVSGVQIWPLIWRSFSEDDIEKCTGWPNTQTCFLVKAFV